MDNTTIKIIKVESNSYIDRTYAHTEISNLNDEEKIEREIGIEYNNLDLKEKIELGFN